MNKLGIYLTNAFFSALIGAVIQIIFAFVWGSSVVTLSSLFGSMGKGVLIGTVSIFFLFQVGLRLKNKPLAGFVSNFVVVAVIISAFAYLDLIKTGNSHIDLGWFIALGVAEILSFVLTAVWYRQINRLNSQLEKKKASIVD